MPSPNCPVGIPQLVKGGAAIWPSGSHEMGRGVHMVCEEWDWRKGKQQHLQYTSHWCPTHFPPPTEICLGTQSLWHSLNDLGIISLGTFSTGQVLPGHYFLHMTRILLGTPKDKVSLVQCVKPKHLGENLHSQQSLDMIPTTHPCPVSYLPSTSHVLQTLNLCSAWHKGTAPQAP